MQKTWARIFGAYSMTTRYGGEYHLLLSQSRTYQVYLGISNEPWLECYIIWTMDQKPHYWCTCKVLPCRFINRTCTLLTNVLYATLLERQVHHSLVLLITLVYLNQKAWSQIMVPFRDKGNIIIRFWSFWVVEYTFVFTTRVTYVTQPSCLRLLNFLPLLCSHRQWKQLPRETQDGGTAGNICCSRWNWNWESWGSE